jgi:hypothetical protein
MSPSAVDTTLVDDRFNDDLALAIVGLGVQYPQHSVGSEELEEVARRHYPETPA